MSLFLISPFCCCSLFRYKKVPQERYNMEILSFFEDIVHCLVSHFGQWSKLETRLSCSALVNWSDSYFRGTPQKHKTIRGLALHLVKTSVGDPNPQDPYIFEPPGSVSCKYGSGSRSFHHQAKIVRNTLISTVL